MLFSRLLLAGALPVLVTSCLSAQLPSPSVPKAGAHYHLSVSRTDMRTVKVRATLVLQDSVLLMVPYGMAHLDDGWRTFVYDEHIADQQGQALPIRRIDTRRWVVGAAPGTTVQLTYVVRIEHDRPPSNWFPGPREAAYGRDWGIFALGRALFVLPGLEMSNSTVEFTVPDGWRVASALPVVAGQTTRMRAHTRRDLVDALFFVGEYLGLSMRQGPLTFDFAIGGPFQSSVPLFERVTRTALQTFRQVFGVDPIKERYLVVVNPEYTQTDGFGGAFRSGFSMTFPFVPSEQNIGVWAFTLTHETFHLWNAFTLTRASSSEEWFLEGSADYYTSLTLARSGVASQAQALGRMGQAFASYQRAAGRVSPADAGAAEARSGTLLYQGGWTILTALDLDIRRRTNDAKSFDDVWRLLVTRLSPTGQGYRNVDILQAANMVSGTDYTDFFARYVTGTEVLDIAPYLRAAGLSVDNGALVPRGDATAVELSRRKAWIGAQ